MFAKLKKKIEEEVGDLGQLTSPLANPFGGGDRRVGGSTQGTNTPNNLGSRQSSLASLVDLHPIDEQISSNSNLSAQSARTSNSAVAARQKAQEALEQELKKVTAEWTRKFDSMKKSYEEKLQNQEADFAWKYSAKEDELEKVRVEKRKLEDSAKNREESYQNKMTRVHDDMDQLEGFAKQETAKVKHLLLNTQADLQKAMADLIERDSELKEVNEVNRNLKAENETILRNMDRDHLQRVKFESEHSESISRISELQNSKADLEKQIREVKEELLESQKSKNAEILKTVKREDSERDQQISTLSIELEKLNEVLAAQEKIRIGLTTDFENQKSENAELLKTLREQHEARGQQISILENELKQVTVDLTAKETLLISLTVELESQKLENAATLKTLNEAHSEREQLKSEYLQLQSHLEDLQAEKAQLNSKWETLEIKHSESISQLSELQNSKADLEKQIREVKEELLESQKSKNAEISKTVNRDDSERDQQISTLSIELERLKEVLAAQEKIRIGLTTDFQNQKSENAELLKTIREQHGQQMSTLEDELKKVTLDLTAKEALLAPLTVELESQKLENAATVKTLNEAHSERGQLKSEYLQLQTRLEEVQAEKAQLNSKLEALEMKHSESISRISELQNSKADLEKQIREVKDELLESQKSKNAEILKTVEREDSERDQQISTLSIELEKLNEVLAAQEKIRIGLTTDFQNQKSENAELLKTLGEQLEARGKQVSTLENELKQVTVDLTAKETLLASLTMELGSQKSENAATLKTLREQHEAHGLQMSKLEYELKQVTIDLTAKEALLTSLTVELESQKLENAATLKTLSEARSEHEQQKSEYLQHQTHVEELHAEKAQLNSKLEALEIKQAVESSRNVEKLLAERAAQDADHNDLLVQVGELQSKTDELEEEIKFLKDEVEARDGKIEDLREKVTANLAAASNNSTSSNSHAERQEDVETYRERIRELESQLNDKNKALKLRQQQLQDLRKTLAKEMRNASSSQLGTSDGMPRSGSQNSLASESRPEEISLAETEPAVIQSSNSHRTEASNNYTEDVNFQYLKTVIFKFVTTSDPQVTHHLTKVVSTLLHLSDEEHRLLEKSTDKRLLTWLGPREHHGY